MKITRRRLALALLVAWASIATFLVLDPPVVSGGPVSDTISVAEFVASQSEATSPPGLLPEGLRGVGRVEPETVFVAEDPIRVDHFDTVFVFLTIDPAGQASVGRLTVDSFPVYTAEIEKGGDVRFCDDGLVLGPAGLICDRAVMGHLYATTELSGGPGGAGGALGLEWQPAYRSRGSLYLTYDETGVWRFGGKWRWQIF